MEDVLDVYTRPYDAHHPQVCMDETGKQLVSEKRTPLPLQPGQPERYDYEYERQGVCNIFLACEPLAGLQVAQHKDPRTTKQYQRRKVNLDDNAVDYIHS